MINTSKTAAAIALARRAHAGQVDKGGEPYINHPLHVAEGMDTEEEACVAILHDVLEDSDFTADDLRDIGMSGECVAAVELLTYDGKADYLDYIRALADNPIAAKVKRADLEHNLDPSRLRRRLTAIDMKRRSRYLEALSVLDECASGAGVAPVAPPCAPSHAQAMPAAPRAPHPGPLSASAAESHAASRSEARA